MSGRHEGTHLDRDDRRHDDDNCFSCLDCGHWSCWHADDHTAVAGLGECDTPWCSCLEAVAVDGERNRCAHCRGYGEIAREPIPIDPQQLELLPCPACGGSGDVQTAVAS